MPHFPRRAGILAHPTSLPGRFGIGDLGPSAYRFVDLLHRAHQGLWQVLPLGPTGYGDSPYAAPSAFAGNPLLIALDPLLEQGLLTEAEVGDLVALPRERVDFERLVPLKHRALRAAFQRFRNGVASDLAQRFQRFRQQEAGWLDDFALFTALHEAVERDWTAWDAPLRDRQSGALREAHQTYAEAVEYHAFNQFLFFEQWAALRAYANDLGIRIIGDIPIFVAHDSVDVWANRASFKLDAQGAPTVVAGVPPDYFSESGQLWGNPLYDWRALAKDGYGWWVERFRQLLRLVDVVRLDHFRGFAAAWEVPAEAETAREGHWVPGPGADLFRTVDARVGQPVPVIAEDLGLITEDVRDLLAELGYPGMKVLQFAFGGDTDHIYLPHMYRDANYVVYTGTHDNDTTRGWYASAPAKEQDFIRRYLGVSGDDIAWDCVRLALRSVVTMAIIPLQDILDLGSEARMNVPGAAHGNWQWRATEEQLQPAIADRLGDLTYLYARC